MTLYEGMFLGLDIVDTYIIYKYISLLYGQRRSRRWVEIGSYVVFYLMSAIVMLLNSIPVINILYTSISYYLLGMNYKASIRKRLLSTTILVVILISIEAVAMAICGIFHFDAFSELPYTEVQAKIICLILEVGTCFFMTGLKNLRNDMIAIRHCVSLLIIPILSLVLIVVINLNLYGNGGVAVFFSIVIFIINVLVFYLYNSLQEMMLIKQEKEILSQQAKAYNWQYEQMKDTIENTRKMNHDMKNLLIQVEALADGGNKKELSELMGDMMKNLSNQYLHSNSGNVVLDSILNYKVEYAKNKNIRTNLKIKIPGNKALSAFDMTVLLGNLLDNAIEAANMAETNSYIDIEIIYELSVLYVKIENSYSVELDDGESTWKRDKEKHGIGLQSVKGIVEKYHGEIKITKRDMIYRTEIWLPDC